MPTPGAVLSRLIFDISAPGVVTIEALHLYVELRPLMSKQYLEISANYKTLS